MTRTKYTLQRFPLWAAAALLGACALGKPQPAPEQYDFGMARSDAPAVMMEAGLDVPPVTAPGWLETPGIVYRLAYDEPGRQRVYAQSRWVVPPPALLTQRLRDRLARASRGGVTSPADSVRAGYTLRIDLQDFSQVFDSADASRGVAAARATLIDEKRHLLLAQKDFNLAQAADAANAAGGVRALSQAGDALVDAVTAWTAQQIAASQAAAAAAPSPPAGPRARNRKSAGAP